MKIFLDTAHIQNIQKWSNSGLIDGITTNPTSLSKEAGLPIEVIKNICKLMGDSPVSVEVTEKDPNAVFEQAKKIAAISDNVVVKIPCWPEYCSVIKKLVDANISLNITLVFTALQGLMMAKLGVDYISPFIGRLEDIDGAGLQVVSDVREIFDTYGYETEILAASVRSVWHMHQAALHGADIVTVSTDIFEKSLYHPLSEIGIDIFEADWKKLGVKQFP
ncbi:MAG: transaldolase family protein [Candidatus Babeliaceae bacterium]|jgi:transaldolase